MRKAANELKLRSMQRSPRIVCGILWGALLLAGCDAFAARQSPVAGPVGTPQGVSGGPAPAGVPLSRPPSTTSPPSVPTADVIVSNPMVCPEGQFKSRAGTCMAVGTCLEQADCREPGYGSCEEMRCQPGGSCGTMVFGLPALVAATDAGTDAGAAAGKLLMDSGMARRDAQAQLGDAVAPFTDASALPDECLFDSESLGAPAYTSPRVIPFLDGIPATEFMADVKATWFTVRFLGADCAAIRNGRVQTVLLALDCFKRTIP